MKRQQDDISSDKDTYMPIGRVIGKFLYADMVRRQFLRYFILIKRLCSKHDVPLDVAAFIMSLVWPLTPPPPLLLTTVGTDEVSSLRQHAYNVWRTNGVLATLRR
jgi:hypothetical protein